jgi:hypothetical protein
MGIHRMTIRTLSLISLEVRSTLYRPLALVALLLPLILCPRLSLAAYIVYADSWNTPTQAQEQAQTINRALQITSATYERATVQGRIFWRVRMGVYATRAEAQSIRQRLGEKGLAESWMREVSDADVQQPPSRPSVPTPPAAVDTVRIDTAARALIDSISTLTRRAVDSLENVSQRRIEQLLEQMRERMADEVVGQIELDRARERGVYVTQMEQAQMTRALLEEMYANIDALRDSLRRDRQRQVQIASLKPVVGGAVTAVSEIIHDQIDDGNRPRKRTFGEAAHIYPRLTLSWGGDRSSIMVDARTNGTAPSFAQAYALWHVRQSEQSTTTIGAGRFDTPYGLEPAQREALLTPIPSVATSLRQDPLDGLWIEPYKSSSLRILLLPYGSWSLDDERFNGLGQVRYMMEYWRAELTGSIEQYRDESERLLFSRKVIFSLQRETDRSVIGFEVGYTDEYGHSVSTLSRGGYDPGDSERITGQILVHRRFGDVLGWTLRGAATRCEGWYSGTITDDVVHEYWSVSEITTGPVFYIGERMRLLVGYSYRDERDDLREETSQVHTFGVALTHTF